MYSLLNNQMKKQSILESAPGINDNIEAHSPDIHKRSLIRFFLQS